MTAGTVKEADAGFNCPCLRITRPKIKTPDACIRDCASAHGARLQRDPQVTPVEPVTAKMFHRRLQRQNFSVMQRIAMRPHAVAGQRDHMTFGIGYGSGHRHLALRGSLCRRLKKVLHDILA